MKKRSVYCVLTILFVSSVSSQLLDFLQECTDDPLVVGIGKCFTFKLEPLMNVIEIIRNITDGACEGCQSDFVGSSSFYTGRRPLQINETNKPKGNDLGSMFSLLNNRLSSKHKNIISHLAQAVKAAIDVEKEVLVAEHLKHSNLQQLLFDYFSELLKGMLTSEEDLDLLIDYFTRHGGLNIPELAPYIDITDVNNTIDCLRQFSQEDFEDRLRWVQCFFKCEDLIPAGTCIQEYFSGCGQWAFVGDIIIRGFAEFANLTSCQLKVVLPDTAVNGSLELEEGGEPAIVTVQAYMPPVALCASFETLKEPFGIIRMIRALLGVLLNRPSDCKASIEMSLQNTWNNIIPHVVVPLIVEIGRPKCHTRKAIRQVVIGNHMWGINSTCLIEVTNDNWYHAHQIPIQPAIDMKMDGNIKTNFTVKLKLEGRLDEILYNQKIETTILDKDQNPKNFLQLCQSSGDPHIMTFDGHYYNNLYDGFFYLYRHLNGPYQAQVIYQRCVRNTNTSCMCSVAIQSGDDVFVVDRCRRSDNTDNGSDIIKKVLLYTNSNLTEGTRIFRQKEGAQFLVILPTGTKFTITDSNQALSVSVRPSNTDWQLTDGLCGTFNGVKDDDLTLPDGNIYVGTGDTDRQQPRNFSKAWRVAADDQIFEGVLENPNVTATGNYCVCTHVLFKGVQCLCGLGENIETCDDITEGEITQYNSAIMRHSTKADSYPSQMNIETDNIDINLNYEPPDLNKWTGKWNETAALAECERFLNNNFLNKCQDYFTRLPSEPFLDDAQFHCVEDIEITDGTAWEWTALQYAQTKCWTAYLQDSKDITQGFLDSIANSTCLSGCSGHGVCIQGNCTCEDGWMGGDCSLIETAWEVYNGGNTKCDTRYEDCSYATIYGTSFPATGITCYIREAQVYSDGPDVYGSENRVGSLFITNYQVACDLPKANSYEIRSADAFLFYFISYDSACYTCDTSMATCQRKRPVNALYDHCLIDGGCYTDLQPNPQDDCKYCNTQVSDSEWDYYLDDVCQEEKQKAIDEAEQAQLEKTLRIVFATVLPAAIIAVTIWIYLRTRNSSSEVNAEREDIEISSITNKDTDQHLSDDDHKSEKGKADYTNLAFVNEAEKGKADDTNLASVNVTVEPDECIEDGHKHTADIDLIHSPRIKRIQDEERGRAFSVSSRASTAEILRIKNAAKERRSQQSRHTSETKSIGSVHSVVSVRSVRSIRTSGIGAGGPIGYAQYDIIRSEPHYEYEVIIDEPGMGAHGSPQLNHVSGTHINTYM